MPILFYFLDPLEFGTAVVGLIYSSCHHITPLFELFCPCSDSVVREIIPSGASSRCNQSIRIISFSIKVFLILGYNTFNKMGKTSTYI